MDYETIDGGISPIKLLLTGASGAGKTYKAAHFPSPVFFNFDNNLSCIRLLPKEIRDNIRSVNPHLKNGKPVPNIAVYENFLSQLEEVGQDPTCKTIVIDSLTTFSDFVMAKTLGINKPTGKAPSQPDYYNFAAWFTNFAQMVLCAENLDKHIVFIAHETLEKDAVTEKLSLKLLVTTSKIREGFGVYFTDVWRCYSVVPTTGKVARMVRTAPTAEASYKCSIPLPETFDFDKTLPQLTELLNSRLLIEGDK
jgi:hypothetical protein